jgi:hypothetical protein
VTLPYNHLLLRVQARLPQVWGGASEFRRRVSVLAGGTALAQVVNFAVAPLLTRIYDASAFGNLQVYSSLMGFAMIVVALRYELAVVLPQDDETAANVAAVALTVVLGMTGLLSAAVGLVVSHRWLLRGAGDLSSDLWLLPIGACGVGVYQVLVKALVQILQNARSRRSWTLEVDLILVMQPVLPARSPALSPCFRRAFRS